MKTFWMILSIYSLGIISGIVLWEKIDFKTIYKGQFKMKQRGRGNLQNAEVTLKTPRETRKEVKKQGRIVKRNEKKKARDLKRLEKTP
jgi:hypothetical protein